MKTIEIIIKAYNECMTAEEAQFNHSKMGGMFNIPLTLIEQIYKVIDAEHAADLLSNLKCTSLEIIQNTIQLAIQQEDDFDQDLFNQIQQEKGLEPEELRSILYSLWL